MIRPAHLTDKPLSWLSHIGGAVKPLEFDTPGPYVGFCKFCSDVSIHSIKYIYIIKFYFKVVGCISGMGEKPSQLGGDKVTP
jgi:hypothetical protein